MAKPTARFLALGLLFGFWTTTTAQAADKAAPTGAGSVEPPDADNKASRTDATQRMPPDDKEAPGYIPGYRRVPSLTLSPHAPLGFVAVPGVSPALGAPLPRSEARFDFHGYLQIPVRMGIGTRPDAAPGQSSTTLHGDPLVAGGAWGWLDQTLTVPGPWAQANFIYGNDVVQATAILGAWNISESMSAATYFQAPAQVWFHDAFLTYTPKIAPLSLKLTAGVFPERYGAMAQYHTGAYGMPLVGTVFGMGTNAAVVIPFEYDLDLRVEGSFKGSLNHPPVGMIGAPSNDYASGAQGSTFVPHGHVGLTWRETATLSVHYISAFARDDRGDGVDDPGTVYNEAIERRDGSLRIAGADFRLNAGRFGYLYVGGVQVNGRSTESISNIVLIMNTSSGKQFMERFWGYGSQGTGGLSIVGGQYTVSLGTLLRYPTEFWGDGPDLLVTLFGMGVHTTSNDPQYDGRDTYKFGTEVTYSPLPWLAVSSRLDRVVPDASDMSKSFMVASPKLVFRSDWQAREALTFQYAGWILGDHVVVNGDTRLLNNPSGRPDKHMFAIYGTMWW